MNRFHNALSKIVEFYISAIILNQQTIAYSFWQFKPEGAFSAFIIEFGYRKSRINW